MNRLFACSSYPFITVTVNCRKRVLSILDYKLTFEAAPQSEKFFKPRGSQNYANIENRIVPEIQAANLVPIPSSLSVYCCLVRPDRQLPFSASMGKNSIGIVQEFQNPQPGNTSTFTLDERAQREILANGITRPKGYTVSYHANPGVEKMHFGPKHPMKPWRLTLTNKIVLAYGMHEAMDVYMARAATNQELIEFHKPEYIDFLQRC